MATLAPSPGVARQLRRSIATRTLPASAALVFMAASAWALSFFSGGTDVIPPHAFYVPILFAAVRFGMTGAAVTGLVSAVAAGPLLPADAGSSERQLAIEWVARGVFFVLIGVVLAAICRNLVEHHRSELIDLSDERELKTAIETNELRLLYQPVVDFDGRVTGVEALVRWDHPERGLVGPDHFIPLAERTGLVIALDQWVLESACAQLAEWRDELLVSDDEFLLAVNISPLELDRVDFARRVAEVLRQSDIPARMLCLEITETALVRDMEASVAHLRALKATGVRLAIDDFGVGYGSLTYVQKFEADIIKIDRSFVESIQRDTHVESVAGGIVMLARTLGMSTVAEGIENDEQAESLAHLGCDRAQGWLFGRPAPADYIADRVRSQQYSATRSRATHPTALPSSARPRADQPVRE